MRVGETDEEFYLLTRPTPLQHRARVGVAVYVPPDKKCKLLKKHRVKAKGQGRIVAKVRTKLTGGEAVVQCRGPFGFPRATRRIKDKGKAKIVIENLFPGQYTCAVQQLTAPDNNTPCKGWFRPIEVTIK